MINNDDFDFEIVMDLGQFPIQSAQNFDSLWLE